MSPLDFNSVEGGQSRLESVAKAKESPQEVKQRLAQYRQTYINEVDSQQRALNADASAFVAVDAQQYLKDAARSLGYSVVNLAVEGENLQRRGVLAVAESPGREGVAGTDADRPAGKPVLSVDKQSALDFSTLAGLKKAVQTELATQAGELSVWRQIEQIGGKFKKGWQSYQKTFATSSSLEGLSANLRAREAQKTTLEDIKTQYESINPTSLSRVAWQEDSRDMGVFLDRIERHLKEGEKVLQTRAALAQQQAGLGALEKSLRGAKTLTAEQFNQHLSSLQQSGKKLSEFQEEIRQGKEGAGEFSSLYLVLQQQYHQPLVDRLSLLHGLLEAKKPAPPAADAEKVASENAAEVEHRFRLFLGGAQSMLSSIDKRVGNLEKELAAAAKKPDLWLSRTDHDAWLSRLDTELGAATDIKNNLASWEQKPDQAAAATDFFNRHFHPALRRAQSLRDRADRERGEAIKNIEKKILNQKIKEMHGELLKEWQAKKESEQYLSLTDKLAALKPGDKEYQALTAKQDALAKDLINYEGKVTFFLSKPDDLEKDLVASLQKLQADCHQWQNQISSDRVLRQSRAAAITEPDQPHAYTVERRTRAYVKSGPMGGGHWEERVEKQEKTEHYQFGQYVQFVNIQDPKHAPAAGQEGRGWIWINGGEKLPDKVKEGLSNRADIIVNEQKTKVEEQSARERREVRQQDLLTPQGREVLGTDAARYFTGVDFLARGEIEKAIAEFSAYLEAAKEFDADKRDLHAACIEDATRQVESHREFPEFLNALKLQAEGKIDEAVAKFKEFLQKINGKFGGSMSGPDQVGPENPARQKYAEQISVAIEVIRKFNNDKLKLLDELSQDFIYLQTVDTARRIGTASPLDFDNLEGAQHEMMLPYIPAKDLTPAERIRQSRKLGGLQGGEVGAIKDAINNLREKIEKGDPPVDFEKELAAIRQDLKKYTETSPGGTVWRNPDTNEVLANSPTSRLLAYFQRINSTNPAEREKGFLAIAAEFKDQEVGMRYTQKYLRQAMVSRYRAFAETEEGQSVAAAVRRRLAADPSINNEITTNARELYKRWAAEQIPPLPTEPPDQVVMQSFKKTIADSIFEDQYEREMRRSMTVRGEKAVTAASELFYKNRGKSRRHWKDLPREEQLSWLAQVGDADLGGALLQGGTLKEYNWSRPYEEDNARWYKPWSWQNYNEDEYNDFKAKAAEITIQTVATLPIGWGAGAVGRAVGIGAIKLLVREGLTEAAVGALSRGGLRALMVAEKAGEKAIWSTLSSGMKARLLLHYGTGIAVEGTALAVMNNAWEGMYNSRSDLFDSLDAGEYGKAGLALLENIAKAGLFRSIGAGQMGVSGLAGPNAKLFSRVLAEAGGETVFGGFGGAGVEMLFMLHDPKLRDELGWEWFAKSVLQNAAGSVAMRAGHSGMRLPEVGILKGSRKGTARRLTAAEMQLNGEILANKFGIYTPADISNARIEANGDLFLSLKSGEKRTIKYNKLPIDRMPPEMQRHIYQTDKNNRDALRALLVETGLDSPINWTGVLDDGAVVSGTGRVVPITDPALLPPILREKHHQMVEERRQARLGPYRRPGRVEPASSAAKTETVSTRPIAAGEKAASALRPAPEIPPRRLPSGEAAIRLNGAKKVLKLYKERSRLSADPQKNAAKLAELDAQINAAAKAKNLSPEQYLRRLQSDAELYRGLNALDRGETQLYRESKVIKKPVLDENGVQKRDANNQPIYEEVNLFANYQSKSAAYSREMLRSLSYERLVAEGGGKIIKLGGDELVVYHAGPDGTVQKLFIDISNMGPTNDTATNIAGSKVNLVDIYLHRLSEAVLAQSKARQGQLLDPVAFNAEVQRVADSLFNLDRDATGKPLDATKAAEHFDRLKAEWGLEGTYQEYFTDMQSMRILAEYRSDTRALDSSYKKHPERTFAQHIDSEIRALSGLTIPQLQKLIADNPAAFKTAFEGRLPKSPKLKAMPVEKLIKEIAKLDPAKSKPEDLMMLYAIMARIDTTTLSTLPALKPLTDQLAASRTALVGDPPHPRVEAPRLMDAKVVSIDLPPDIAKALSALGETDPVRAHAILTTARQFSEKSLDALKYGQRGRFAQFKITDYVELKNGQLQVKPTAPDFLQAVEMARNDKKISNVVDAEDSLRLTRSRLETLQRQLADGEITHQEFLRRSSEVEIEIKLLRDKLTIDPDTAAYGQAYLDIRPTAMYLFGNNVILPKHCVWNSVVTELGHSGVINAKYGYQAMDSIMAGYFKVLQDGISAELPADLRHFKIMRSGGGKFEVVFLDARAVDHLAQKGLTPASLVDRLARGPGQEAVDRALQSDPAKVAASQSDAAVRNSQFRYNKGTEVITVGRLTSRAESNFSSEKIAEVQKNKPKSSCREILALSREQAGYGQVGQPPKVPGEFPASPGLAYSGNTLADFPANMTGHIITLPGSPYNGWVIMKDHRQVNGTLEISRWNEGSRRFEGGPLRIEPASLDFAHFHDFRSGLETIPSLDVMSRFDRIGNNLERVLRYIDDFNSKSRVEADSRDGKIYGGEDWEVYIDHDGKLQFFILAGGQPARYETRVPIVEGRPVTEHAAGIPDAMIDRLMAGEHLDSDTGLDRPVRLDNPIEKARAERLDAEVEQFFQSELQGRTSADGQMIYFNKEHADGRLERNRDLRKAYVSPPYDQMVPFVRELMKIMNERNLGMQGAKFFKPAIERDGAGNIVGQNYAGLCFYFANDADFGQFIAAVREAKQRTGTALLSSSDQHSPGTGKIEGGQILFGVDNPQRGSGGFTHGSLSRELESAALAAMDRARKEGKSPQEIRLAMRESMDMVVRQNRGIGLDNILELNSPHGLSENQLQLIRERHPRDFQEVLPLYERIPEMGRVLEEMGLHDCAAQLMDLNSTFSQVDGFVIDTPVKRLAYFSYLNNIVAGNPLLRQWYMTRPRMFHPQDLAAAANFKEFNRIFVQEQVIPFLAGKRWSIIEKSKIIHEWLARGSLAQREVLANSAESYSISGQYREVNVSVGPYRPPGHMHVRELMGLYDAHIQALGRQLEQMKGRIPDQEFERNVLKLAAYTMQNFSRIHPMRDGNGRTARALYDYIVFKYLGADSPHRQLPLEADNDPVSLGSLRGDLNDTLFADRDGLFAEAQDPNRILTPAEKNELRNHNATALKERFLDNQWEKLAQDPDVEAFVTRLLQPTEAPRESVPPPATQEQPAPARHVAPEMHLSGFSDKPPANLATDSPGWIDTTGRIFYNPRALNSLLASGYTVVASEPGQGIRIRTPDNQIINFSEYRSLMRGTPHEATSRALLEKMTEIKNHESMHRVTTLLKDPVSLFAQREGQNALPEGKVELTDVVGKPLPLTAKNVDEFISRVADGTQLISTGQRALLQKAIATELRAKGIKNFTFEAVRRADTRLLVTNPREAFRRAEAAAKDGPVEAPPSSRQGPAIEAQEIAFSIDQSSPARAVESLLSSLAEPTARPFAGEILGRLIRLARRQDAFQEFTADFPNFRPGFVPTMARLVYERYEQNYAGLSDSLARAKREGPRSLAELNRKLIGEQREFVKYILEEAKDVNRLLSERNSDNSPKTPDQRLADQQMIIERIKSGQTGIGRYLVETLIDGGTNGRQLLERLLGGAKAEQITRIRQEMQGIYRERILSGRLGSLTQDQISRLTTPGQVDLQTMAVIAGDTRKVLTSSQLDSLLLGGTEPVRLQVLQYLLQHPEMSSALAKRIFKSTLFGELTPDLLSRLTSPFTPFQAIDLVFSDTRGILTPQLRERLLKGEFFSERIGVLAAVLEQPGMNADFAVRLLESRRIGNLTADQLDLVRLGEVPMQVLRILANDKRELITSSQLDYLIDNNVDLEILTLLERHADHRYMNTDLVEKMLHYPPETISVSGRPIRFFDAQHIAEGGFGVVFRAAVIGADGTFTFIGCKHSIEERGAVIEAETVRRMGDLQARGLDTFHIMRYQGLSDRTATVHEGEYTFFELSDYMDRSGRIIAGDLDKLNADLTVPEQVLYQTMLGGGRALVAFEQMGMIQMDSKLANYVPAQDEGGRSKGVHIDLGFVVPRGDVINTPMNPNRGLSGNYDFGYVPEKIGVTPGYYSSDLFALIRSGVLPPERYHNYTFGVAIEAMVTGILVYPRQNPADPDHPIPEPNLMHIPRPLPTPPYPSDANARLLDLASRLKSLDPGGKLTMADAVREFEQIINLP